MRVGILLCLLSLASGDAPPPAVSSPHFLKKWISFLEGGDWEGGVCCLETFIVASRASDEPSLPSWAFQVWDPQLEAPGDEQRGVSPGWKAPPATLSIPPRCTALFDPFTAKALQILCSHSVYPTDCPAKDARGRVCGPTVSILPSLLRRKSTSSCLQGSSTMCLLLLVQHTNLGTTLNHDDLCRQTSAWSTEFGPYKEQGTGGQVTVGDVIRVQGLGNPVRAPPHPPSACMYVCVCVCVCVCMCMCM